MPFTTYRELYRACVRDPPRYVRYLVAQEQRLARVNAAGNRLRRVLDVLVFYVPAIGFWSGGAVFALFMGLWLGVGTPALATVAFVGLFVGLGALLVPTLVAVIMADASCNILFDTIVLLKQ